MMKNFFDSALLTDFYELTMLQAYFRHRMNATASFEFFVRKLPDNRNFLVAAGLEQVVDYLMNLRFKLEDIAWLRTCGKFDNAFIDSLRDFRFTGDVDAMPEGTVFFENEPILRITAPLREAQFVESRVMNLLHFQTLVASKAARCVIAANGKHLVDFGLRRAHGAEAALLSARASYLAGFDGTATTLAATIFDIPVFGTMAHSFVQVHENEYDAFLAFARTFPNGAILLIDTYDAEKGAQNVVKLAQQLKADGIRLVGVRIDSGDLKGVAMQARQILDAGGCPEIAIIASGNLDEYAVAQLVQEEASVDGFGVGTRMNTSADSPYLDCAYKLVEYDGHARRKRSPGKETWPGRKQVYRAFATGEMPQSDVIALNEEKVSGQALLKPVMAEGRLLQARPSLQVIRSFSLQQIQALPAEIRRLDKPSAYTVMPSPGLQTLTRQVDARQDRRKNAPPL